MYICYFSVHHRVVSEFNTAKSVVPEMFHNVMKQRNRRQIVLVMETIVRNGLLGNGVSALSPVGTGLSLGAWNAKNRRTRNATWRKSHRQIKHVLGFYVHLGTSENGVSAL